jgi:hypothetical protein
MEWQYVIEEISATASKETIEEQLFELGSGGWEAVTSWATPGDQHINKGAWLVHIIFKKPK